MLIWVGKEFSDEKEIYQDMGIRSWRWEYSLGYKRDAELYFYISADLKMTKPYEGIITHYREFYFRPFYWGFSYNVDYYDGCHKSLRFGPLSFCWGR